MSNHIKIWQWLFPKTAQYHPKISQKITSSKWSQYLALLSRQINPKGQMVNTAIHFYDPTDQQKTQSDQLSGNPESIKA